MVSGISGWLQHLQVHSGLLGHHAGGGLVLLIKAEEAHGHVPAPGQQVHHLVSVQLNLQGEQPNRRILMDHPTSRRTIQPKLIMGLPGAGPRQGGGGFLAFNNPGAGQGLPSLREVLLDEFLASQALQQLLHTEE